MNHILQAVSLLILLAIPAGAAEEYPIKGVVVDGFDAPVAGAAVKYYLRAGDKDDFDGLARPFLTLTTGTEGDYSGSVHFHSTGQRDFTVTAEKQGYYASWDHHISFGVREPKNFRTRGRVVLRSAVSPGELKRLSRTDGVQFAEAFQRLLRSSRACLIRSLMEAHSAESDKSAAIGLRTKLLPVLRRIASDPDSELKQDAHALMWFLGDIEQMRSYHQPRCFGRYYLEDSVSAPTVQELVSAMAAAINARNIRKDPRFSYEIATCVHSPFQEKVFVSVNASSEGRYVGVRHLDGFLVVAIREAGLWRAVWRESRRRAYTYEAGQRFPWEEIFPELLTATLAGRVEDLRRIDTPPDQPNKSE